MWVAVVKRLDSALSGTRMASNKSRGHKSNAKKSAKTSVIICMRGRITSVCLLLYHQHLLQSSAYSRFPINSYCISNFKKGQNYLKSGTYKNILTTKIECGAKVFVSWRLCCILRVKYQKYSEGLWGLRLQVKEIILSAWLHMSAIMVRVADVCNQNFPQISADNCYK